MSPATQTQLARLTSQFGERGMEYLPVGTPQTKVRVEQWLSGPCVLSYPTGREDVRETEIAEKAARLDERNTPRSYPKVNAYVEGNGCRSNGAYHEPITFCRISEDTHRTILENQTPNPTD